MNEMCAKSGRRWQDERFFYIWISVYFLGAMAGILAARVCCAALGVGLIDFCGSIYGNGFAARPIFFSSALLFLLTILLSQLPGGAYWTLGLVGIKAFCTAFVFGIFYLWRQFSGLHIAPLFLAVHSLLLLPAFYFLVCHCRRVRLSGRGRYWFRYRLLPVGLAFLYLLIVVWLEQLLLALF